MSYSAFFRLGLSLASEPKDSHPLYLSPLPPIPTTSSTATRPISRRRRSSLTILTTAPLMSSLKSARVLKPDLELIGLVNVLTLVGAESERLPPPIQRQLAAPPKRVRRKTVTTQPPILLTIHQHRLPASVPLPPLRFPPPTTPLPPTPLFPSFSTWSEKKKENSNSNFNRDAATDPVLPQTPTHPRPPSMSLQFPLPLSDEEMKDA